MTTRNQALFALMSEPLKQQVFKSVNATLSAKGATTFSTIEEMVKSSVASTLFDNDAGFMLALATVRQAAFKAAATYHNVWTNNYALGYVSHVLMGNVHPQAIDITIGQAVAIRNKIDKAISNAGINKKGGK